MNVSSVGSRRVRGEKKRIKSGYGEIRGVIRANGGWMFVVQALGTEAEATPRLCKLVHIEDLRGNRRRKAERWTAYLNGDDVQSGGVA